MYFKLLRSSWDDFALCAGVLAGFFLVAHIVTAVVLAFFFDGTSLMLSGMILPIVSAFLILIYSLSYSMLQFSVLVRFGCTRRRSLALSLGMAAIVALFCMALSALLGIGSGAALVLEEYEHAVRRGAKIYGEVVGYGATCDAFHITAPRPEGTCGARAIQQALTEAGHQPGEVVYINAHGTGTPMNDSLETKVVKLALGEEEAKKAYMSSTKSMTGHMLGAAGAVEAIACLKALNESILPPTINLLDPDPACDLNNVPNVAIHADVDLVLSNSLGFGGHNACIAFRKVTK